MTGWAVPLHALAGQRATRGGADVVAHRLDMQPSIARLRFGTPDRSDLRVGERHPRYRSMIRLRLLVAAGDDVTDESGLVLALVGEQRTTVDVTGGVQPSTFDPEHPAPVVHF